MVSMVPGNYAMLAFFLNKLYYFQFWVGVCVCARTRACVCVCMYVCMYVCVYIYIGQFVAWT